MNVKRDADGGPRTKPGRSDQDWRLVGPQDDQEDRLKGKNHK